MTSLLLSTTSLDRAARAAADGRLDVEVAAAAHAHGWSDERIRRALEVIGTPVLRLSIEGRQGGRTDSAHVWADEQLSVLGAPMDDARLELVAGHTSHLALQAAAALGLAPRPRAHQVAGPLRLPVDVLQRVLAGERVELPEALPRHWRDAVGAWGPDVRQLQVTAGHQAPDGTEQWRSLLILDDLQRGLFLVQHVEQPEVREVLPTDPTQVLCLITRLLSVQAT